MQLVEKITMMNKNLLLVPALFCCMALCLSFTAPDKPSRKAVKRVNWYTWEEAIAANQKEPRKIMVDIYTGWCGWCKRMDKSTFENANVAAYLNENFYPVKLDAEMKENINFNDHTFKYIANAGRRGVHELAYALLDGKMSYPSIVFLNENIERIMVSKGYKDAKQFSVEMKYTAEEAYKTQNLDTYKKSGK